MPAARSTAAGHRQFGGQRHFPVPGRGGPDVLQRLPGQPLDVADFDGRRGRIAVDQPAGQSGLDRDRGQRMTEDVVQIPADPFPFRGDRGDRELLPGPAQLDVQPDVAGEARP